MKIQNCIPGMLKKHYSPGIPIFLNQKDSKNGEAFITFGKNTKITIIISILKKIRLERSSPNLYRVLKNKKT